MQNIDPNTGKSNAPAPAKPDPTKTLPVHASTSNDFDKLNKYFGAIDVVVRKVAQLGGIAITKLVDNTDPNTGKPVSETVIRDVAELAAEIAGTEANKFLPGSGPEIQAIVTTLTTDVENLYSQLESVTSALKGTAPAGGSPAPAQGS